MSIVIKTPKQVAQEYLDNLKVLKPEINIDQEDSDWWIRAQVVGGVVAGVYADLNRISNDTFPQSARREAVDKHLQTYFGSGLREAQPAQGNVAVTTAASGTITSGTRFTHTSTGNVYLATSNSSVTGTSGTVSVISIIAGQNQNLLTGTSLEITSPPTGFLSTATVLSPGITEGTNVETTQQGANRVLNYIRASRQGGTSDDYLVWTYASDSSITQVKINGGSSSPYGLGTVQIVISAGTNDIDTAIDNDLAISWSPTDALREQVRLYVEALNPICDVAYVDAPTQLLVDLTVHVAFVSGNQNTIVTGSLTQDALLIREIKRAIYKTPIGGRNVNGVYELRASDIEDMVTLNLAATTFNSGLKYQIVGDKQINLTGGGPNIAMTSTQIAIPNTITIVEDL